MLAAILLVGACSTPPASAPPSGVLPSESPGATIEASPGASEPAVSPSIGPASAGRIAFVRFDTATGHFLLYSMNPDGTGLEKIEPHQGRLDQDKDPDVDLVLPRWSPDGTLLLTQSLRRDGFETIIPADFLQHWHLHPPDSSTSLRCSAWTPDNLQLICEGWSPLRRGREGLYSIRALNAGDLTRLTTTTDGIHDIPGDVSTDGTKILFVRATYTPLMLGQIWICDIDGGNPHKITDTLAGYRVSWSDDGRWIVGDSGGSLVVFDMQNLGADPVKIDIPGGAASQPRWSPDATRIVFELRKNALETQIVSIARDGSDLVRLTTGHDDESPDWGTPGF
jgi:Tol biopolymer transport system component